MPSKEELAVATAKALTRPPDPDNETLDEAHVRIGQELAASEQEKEIRNPSIHVQREARRQWKTDRTKTLSKAASKLLCKHMAGIKDGILCVFAERVMRAYNQQQKSAVHLHFDKVLKYAVTQVFAAVRPSTDKPYAGNVTKACKAMTPIAFKVFNIRCDL